MKTTQNVIKTSPDRKPSVSKDFIFSRDNITNYTDNQDLLKVRENAYKNFKSINLPTINDESWRRTNLKGFQPDKFVLPVKGNGKVISESNEKVIKQFNFDDNSYNLLLFNNGDQKFITKHKLPQGVVFTSLKEAEERYIDILLKIIGKHIKPENGKFAALTEAFATNGFLLYVPENMHVELPLNCVFCGTNDGMAYLNHFLIYLENNSSATIINEVQSLSNSSEEVMHSYVVEGYVGKNSKLNYIDLQTLGRNYWNFGQEKISVDNDGEVNWIVGSLGSKLSKTFYDLDLIGEGSTGNVSGFYFLDGTQHFDHDTQQNHLEKNTTSDLLFKGALIDNARSVWQGMIYVAEGAQKADGFQSNRNILLSKDARADSIPGLEILADDVRCTHGATVGTIDSDQLFYLKSRGIEEKDAKVIILEGFFDPILARIPNPLVKEFLLREIRNKMKF